MRSRLLALFSILGLVPLVAQESLPPGQPTALQKYEGSSPQTTPPFSVADQWEVRWMAYYEFSVSVLAADNTVVAGASGSRGVVYVPKGGVFHLQIDATAPQPAPDSNGGQSQSRGATGFENTINGGGFGTGSGSNNNNNNNNGYGNNNSPNSGPHYPPGYMAMRSQPWRVEVAQVTAGMQRYAGNGMQNYVLPAGANTAAPAATAAATPALAAATGTATPPAAPGTPATPTPTPPPAETPQLTADQARAVVLIRGDNGEGTGFMVKTPTGPVVITNIHVIANNPNLKVTTNTGALVPVVSQKCASDRDLAMLIIEDKGYNYLEMATDISKVVQPNDAVITPGNSQGGEVMLNTNGKVLAIGPEKIEIDNPIYHGNSGGPVFHPKSGKVLGVVTEAMKVNMSNDLDKASFASRNSAIAGSMRYFALRLDTVSSWITIDSRQFATEMAFLDQFQEQSRRLDAFLNGQDDNSRSNGGGSGASKIYLNDDRIMKANHDFERNAAGADTAQRIQALREMLFALQAIADSNYSLIADKNNFYTFDRERADDERAYRAALRKELDSIGNNVERLGGLPRSN